jgi:hypothetical protein
MVLIHGFNFFIFLIVRFFIFKLYFCFLYIYFLLFFIIYFNKISYKLNY